MNKPLTFKRILIYIISAAFIGVIIYLLLTSGKITMYKDESTTGNTSGNLLNGGLFCENDGKIYFANPYDSNKLYCMDSDLSNVKKLFDDRVSYLNSAGKYIFYTKRNDQLENDGNALLSLSTTGLFRITTSGHSPAKLYDDPTQVVCLFGNNIYYQHYDQKKGLELYSTKIDKSEEKRILSEAAAPYAVSNGKIYYTGWDKEHNINSINIDGTGRQVIHEGNFTSLTRQGDYLYFMDMGKDYCLCRIPIEGGTVETIVNQRIATYNVAEDGSAVYYQIDNGNDNGLYKLDLTNNNSSLILSGNYNYLNITSNYLFFESFDQSELYTYNFASQSVNPLNIEKED